MGYEQLSRLSTLAWLNSYFDRGMERVPTLKSELAAIIGEDKGHLIAQSACFLRGQKVRTRSGEKNIEEITKTDEILTKDGKWEKINFPTNRLYIGQGQILNFCKEPQPIRCTANHQFLVYNSKNKTLEWIEAKNLKKNDKCLEPIVPVCYSNNTVLNLDDFKSIKDYRLKSQEQNYKHNIFRLPEKIIITNELMRLFGLWLADGHISLHEEYNKYNIGFTFSEQEFDIFYNSFVKQGLSDLGLSEENYSINHRPQNHRVDLNINKVEICLLFKEIFGISHANDKHIPLRLKHISYDLDVELFFGYFLGDGYFRYRKSQGGELVAASISYQLIKDFEQLGLAIDLSGSITISQKHTDKNNTVHQESYYLTYSNAFLGKMLNKSKSFSHEELIKIFMQGAIKKDAYADIIYFEDTKYRIKKVKSNENFLINEQVYCLNTNSHSFVLNNIIVHNCLGGELSTETMNLIGAEKCGDRIAAEKAHNNIVQFMFFCLDLFGDDFYVEVAPGLSKEQIAVNKRLKSIADAFGCKMSIGCDAHFMRQEDKYVHNAFLNSKGGERETDAFYKYAHLYSAQEAEKNLLNCFDKDFIQEIFQNSLEIKNKIEFFDLFHKQSVVEVPVKNYDKKSMERKDEYPILESLFTSDNEQERYWINQCWEGLQKKFNCSPYDKPVYLKRLEEEATTKKIIGEKLETNLFAYPITLQHYIDLIWKCGSIVACGRGSGCSGLNHWLLGVTQANPVRWEFPWFRYLNEERIELPDIDFDLCPSKRPKVIREIKKERQQYLNSNLSQQEINELGCTLVSTYGTITTKNSILVAARGYRSEEYPNGIDVDEAQYISSLISSERGFLWSVSDTVYGNKEKDREPNKAFISAVSAYPGLLEIILGIEGLIDKRSSHASGIMFFDKNPYKHCCFMRTPSGEVITQWDLHDAEYCGNVKYDALVTEICDKITNCIELLQKDNKIDPNLSLKEAYFKYLDPEKIDYNDERVWKAIDSGNILNLFQFDSLVGATAIKKLQPTNMKMLTACNGLMRLMTSEKGAEMPLDRYARLKNDMNQWYQEMDDYGLTKEEQKVLEPYFKEEYGTPSSQETLMLMLMDKNICGFTLVEANAARKTVAKKHMNEIPILRENVLSKAKSPKLGEYVWKFGVMTQLGYSFSYIHGCSYSMIGYQTAFLATNWNSIYWNTSCLIVNSGSLEDAIVDEDDETVVKKKSNTDYAKVAKSLGEIRKEGIEVSLVDINNSQYSFSPDAKNNKIQYALKALTRVGDDLIDEIIKNRPYVSMEDFYKRIKPNKSAMITLIKSGAFDCFKPRKEVFKDFIWMVSDIKSTLNLRNVQGLIRNNLLPKELEQEIRIFNFNKYLKATKEKVTYTLNDTCIDFLAEIDCLDLIDGDKLDVKVWEKYYKKRMKAIGDYIKENLDELLEKMNNKAFKDEYVKYCGRDNLSAWEMDSLCFYYHTHELQNIDKERYGLTDLKDLPNEPVVERIYSKNGKSFPIYKLQKICGTCVAKDRAKRVVYLLTTDGIIPVKFRQEQFAIYDKIISEIQPDGTKKRIEKSWFDRGNMLIIQGIKRENQFFTKKYSKTSTHEIYKIDKIYENGTVELIGERAGMGI